jgi:hypothetical protein
MADESQQRQEPSPSKRHKILSHLPIVIKVLQVASIRDERKALFPLRELNSPFD